MPIATEGTRVASSITWRVFAGTAIIVGVVVMVSLVMASSAARRSADATARRSLEQAADLVAQLLAGRERSLAGGARVFVQGPYFRTLVAERRRDDILDQTFEAVEQLDAKWVFITDGHGVLLAKSDEPSAVGDDLGQVPLVSGALRGQVSGGFGASGDSLLFQATAVPVALPDGAPFGVLVATRVIDSLLIADIRSATASEIVFFARDAGGNPQVVASTLPITADVRNGIARLVAPDVRTGLDAPMTRPLKRELTLAGVTWRSQSASWATAGGDVIGGFVVLRPLDGALATLAGVRRSLFTAGALGFVMALLAAWIAARSVTRPVRALAVAVRRAADGNYAASEASVAADVDSTGDIGSLARAFDALLVDLRDKDSLSATTAAAVAVDESRRDAQQAADAKPVRRGSARELSFGGTAARVAPNVMVQRGYLLANRYRIEAMIGSGGMGVVYRARDRVLGEAVAIKLLRPEMVAADSVAQEQLRNELRMARRITHRNVVRTHDIGDSDGVPFLTMEYVEGASLSTVIRVRGSLPVPAVLSLARQLMRALAAAHEQEIVHGDIKPQNLLVGPNGVLKVTDFGVARVVRSAQRTPGIMAPTSADVSGRLGGAIIGTPEYLAPEQLIGGPATVATDLYAAGIVLHECLVGATPSGADTPMAFLASKLAESPARVTRPTATVALELRATRGVPPLLNDLVAWLTQADPQQRPISAAAVLAQLARIG
ncbi:MAG: protein kinase [Gemmatimonas sp.]